MKMEFGLKIPSFSRQEQQSDSVQELFFLESDQLPPRDFIRCLTTCENFASVRHQAVSFIVQAQFSCLCDPDVAYIAINYVQRFISKKKIMEAKPWAVTLTAVTCISLASKMMNTPLSISQIQALDQDYAFDYRSINRMELLVLDMLNWRMRSITPFSFFPFFISLMGLDEELGRAIQTQATNLVFKALNDMNLLAFKPSITAASALLVAHREFCPLSFLSARCSIFSIENLNNDKLEECFSSFLRMVTKETYECSESTSSDCTERTNQAKRCNGSELLAEYGYDADNTSSMVTSVNGGGTL